ncbi:MAG: hypothetical protein SGJ04_04445 [Bacteroidota bacterium]|nr:hypothetical protein [Bacteroidota bacterium]
METKTIVFIALTVISFLISWLGNRFLISYLIKKNQLDTPNERSSHTKLTPRGGGRAIFVSIFISLSIYCLYAQNLDLFILLFISSVIAMLGWIDDLRNSRGGLGSGIRSLIQLFCAIGVVIYFGPVLYLPLPSPLDISLGWLKYLIAIIWIIGITNIYNFLDGIDGHAGTQGFIAGLGLFIFSFNEFNSEPFNNQNITGLIIAASCLGFLMVNWHPAKIFLGDVGSTFLGFLLSSYPFYIQKQNDYFNTIIEHDFQGHLNTSFASFLNSHAANAFYAMAILIWFFLLDGTFTMIRRAIKREKVWKPHRSHLYQRLNIAGWKHSQIVLFISLLYTIILVYQGLVYGFVEMSPKWDTIVLALICFIVLILVTFYVERKHKSTKALH